MKEFISNSDKIGFIEKIFGQCEIGSNNNIQIKCPKCDLDNKNAGIRLNKRKLAISLNKNLIFHCWVCGYSGRFIKLLKDFSTQNILLEYIKNFSNEKEFKAEIVSNKKKNEFVFPQDFRLLVDGNDYYIKKSIEYIKKRNISDDDMWFYRLGVSEVWPWKHRILMPSFDKDGDINILVGRMCSDLYNPHYWDSSKIGKKRSIFNEINIDFCKELTITEGPFDLMKCDDNATILLGSDLSCDSYLFCQIVKNKTPILLGIDQDMIYKKIPKIVNLLLKSGNNVRVLDFGNKKDVGDMSKEEFMERKYYAKQWDRISSLYSQISLIGK